MADHLNEFVNARYSSITLDIKYLITQITLDINECKLFKESEQPRKSVTLNISAISF